MLTLAAEPQGPGYTARTPGYQNRQARSRRHNRPLAIDHVGGRYATHPELPGDVHTYVHRCREGIAAFGHEGLDRFLATAIDRDGQYHYVLVLKGLVYPLHGGHLALADGSPGRPEAHDHDFALQIC